MRGRLSFHPAPTRDVRSSGPAANSLFHNILRVTHLNAIFCEHKCIYFARNLPGFNILRKSIKNSLQCSSSVNSLFCNILPITHLNAIFCKDKCISPVSNCLEFNILRTSIQNPEDTQVPKIASSMPHRGTRLCTRHRPAPPLPSGSIRVPALGCRVPLMPFVIFTKMTARAMLEVSGSRNPDAGNRTRGVP